MNTKFGVKPGTTSNATFDFIESSKMKDISKNRVYATRKAIAQKVTEQHENQSR